MTTLNQAEISKTYTITGFSGSENKVLRRFFELGFSVGQKVKVISKSLQKKVFLVEIRGYLLSIRASLLSFVQVKL